MYRIILANITLKQTIKNKSITSDLNNICVKVDSNNIIVGERFLKQFKDYEIVKIEVLKEIGTTQIKD